MKNLSFEDGWETLPPTGNAGWLQNQRPNHWQLTILPPGAELWDSADTATGEPEAVHKGVNQLPPDEQPGGADPLILDGEWVYKIFHSGAAYGVELRQVVEGLKPGSSATAVVRIRVHDHKGTDPYGCEFRMISNGKGQWWHKDAGQLVNFKWVERRHTRTVGDDGRFELIIQLKTKYSLPVDFFLDAFEFTGEYADTEPPVDPPPDPDPDPDPDPPPTDHEHPDISAKLDTIETLLVNLQAQVDNLELRVGWLEDGGPTQPPQLITLPFRSLAVDVSANNGEFDWEKAKAGGVKYAILRSSNGMGSSTTDNNGRDLQLFRNAIECTRLSIPFSIYHYLQPGQTTAQVGLVNAIYAELVQLQTPPTGARLENGRILPLVWCDVESFALSIASIKLFCEILACGIYTSAYYWNSIAGNTAAWWAGYPLWAAHWTGNNNGQIPPETAVPILPHDFDTADLWQFTSKGGALIGWPGGLDVSLVGPFTAVTPPPTGETINIRPYLEPQGDFGPYKVLSWLDGSRTQPQQLLRRETGILEAKGEGEWVMGKRYDHYERYAFIDGNMKRYEDTSPGSLEAYTQHGARWLPEVVTIGERYINQPRVTKHSLIDCKLISDKITTDYLTVTKRHDKWQALNGIVVDDVIEIEWRKSPDGPVIERYFYGKDKNGGLGLVGWGKVNLEVALSELPQGRTPLDPVLWKCG